MSVVVYKQHFQRHTPLKSLYMLLSNTIDGHSYRSPSLNHGNNALSFIQASLYVCCYLVTIITMGKNKITTFSENDRYWHQSDQSDPRICYKL